MSKINNSNMMNETNPIYKQNQSITSKYGNFRNRSKVGGKV